MQAALTAVIALLSLSLVSCFLDKEIFEFCIQEKVLKWATVAYIVLVLLILALALIVLPDATQAESYSGAGRWTQAVYVVCAVASVSTFFLQALFRYLILIEGRNPHKSVKSLRLRRARTTRRSTLRP